MATKPSVHFKPPADLLTEVDRLAREENRTRTGMVVRLLVEAITARKDAK